LADAGDSLYALNKVIFEEKRFSLEEFVQILRDNFRGREDLRSSWPLNSPVTEMVIPRQIG